ncbi:hypothetical protein DSECCO2_645580 [anaerobic digester metagenome]
MGQDAQGKELGKAIGMLPFVMIMPEEKTPGYGRDNGGTSGIDSITAHPDAIANRHQHGDQIWHKPKKHPADTEENGAGIKDDARLERPRIHHYAQYNGSEVKACDQLFPDLPGGRVYRQHIKNHHQTQQQSRIVKQTDKSLKYHRLLLVPNKTDNW